MKLKSYNLTLCALFGALALSGCAVQETSRVVKTQTVVSYDTNYTGKKQPIIVGNFSNRSNYMQGLFTDSNNQMGTQAKTILKNHLQQSRRFALMERDELENLSKEAAIGGGKQTLKGAKYAITGAVTEFGRKEVGDKQLFGLLGSGKSQIAYSKVSLSVVNVKTAEVIYATQGASEYALSEREVFGFGSSSGYDATLTGKVLNLAIIEVVNKLVADLESGKLAL